MSTKETHFYTDKCDSCGLTHERKFGEDRTIKTYYYGLNKKTDGYPEFLVEHAADLCGTCCNIITGKIDFAIKN